MSLSHNISKYFTKLSLNDILLVVKTDNNGKILEWEFTGKEFNNLGICEGNNLSDYFIALEGIISSGKKGISLSNINLDKSLWVNIEIKNINDDFLVVIEDNTENVIKLKEVIQKKNESELNQ